MSRAISIVLFTVGAVLRFAISSSPDGISVHTLGVILMAVGCVGFLLRWLLPNPAPRRRGGLAVRSRQEVLSATRPSPDGRPLRDLSPNGHRNLRP